MQTVSTAYLWRLVYWVLSSKTLASKTTTLDTELFAIKLGVSKTTSMNIEYIILITNFLGSIRKIVDLSVYTE